MMQYATLAVDVSKLPRGMSLLTCQCELQIDTSFLLAVFLQDDRDRLWFITIAEHWMFRLDHG